VCKAKEILCPLSIASIPRHFTLVGISIFNLLIALTVSSASSILEKEEIVGLFVCLWGLVALMGRNFGTLDSHEKNAHTSGIKSYVKGCSNSLEHEYNIIL
jgi:hypothetical protein